MFNILGETLTMFPYGFLHLNWELIFTQTRSFKANLAEPNLNHGDLFMFFQHLRCFKWYSSEGVSPHSWNEAVICWPHLTEPPWQRAPTGCVHTHCDAATKTQHCCFQQDPLWFSCGSRRHSWQQLLTQTCTAPEVEHLTFLSLQSVSHHGCQSPVSATWC